MENHSLSFEELQRYGRHLTLPYLGVEGQKKLKAAKVLCVGAGGLGAPALLYLAAAGVGTLGIMDGDQVELSNLQRQILYDVSHVGHSKVMMAKKRLEALNPHVNIIPHDTYLTSENAFSYLSSYDYILDGTDNLNTRYLLNDACFHLKKPFVYASIFQFEGQCSLFSMKENTPCYRCLFEAPLSQTAMPNCAEGGVLGVLPGILGTLQANEIIKLILNIGTSLESRLLTIQALSLQFKEYEFQKNPHCPLCSQKGEALLPETQWISIWELETMQKNKMDFILLDVREPQEYEHFNLGGYLIPLQQLKNRVHELDKEKQIIIHCRTDGRSQQAFQWLREIGFEKVKYLKGGALAWAAAFNSQQ